MGPYFTGNLAPWIISGVSFKSRTLYTVLAETELKQVLSSGDMDNTVCILLQSIEYDEDYTVYIKAKTFTAVSL